MKNVTKKKLKREKIEKNYTREFAIKGPKNLRQI